LGAGGGSGGGTSSTKVKPGSAVDVALSTASQAAAAAVQAEADAEAAAVVPRSVDKPVLVPANKLLEMMQDRELFMLKSLYASVSASRSNGFDDLGEFFVKRGMVSALGRASYVTEPPAELRGARQRRACAFRMLLSFLLSNDNTTSAFDDEHYVADLLAAATNAAKLTGRARVRCSILVMRFALQLIRVREVAKHESSGVLVARCLESISALHATVLDGVEDIIAAIETQGEGSSDHLYNSLLNEPSICSHDLFYGDEVQAATSSADIVDVVYKGAGIVDSRSKDLPAQWSGSTVSEMRAQSEPWLLKLLVTHCSARYPMRVRKAAASALLDRFSGHIRVLHVVFTLCESAPPDALRSDNHLSTLLNALALTEEGGSAGANGRSSSFKEGPAAAPFRLRRAILKRWLQRAVRRSSSLRVTMQRADPLCEKLCRRVLLMAFTEPEPELRDLSADLARVVYGRGVPLCLLTDAEYEEKKSAAAHMGPAASDHERRLSDGRKVKIRPVLFSGDTPANSFGGSSRASPQGSRRASVDLRRAREHEQNAPPPIVVDISSGGSLAIGSPQRHGHDRKQKKSGSGKKNVSVPIVIDAQGVIDVDNDDVPLNARRTANASAGLARGSTATSKKRKKRDSTGAKADRICLPAHASETGAELTLDTEDSVLLRRAWKSHRSRNTQTAASDAPHNPPPSDEAGSALRVKISLKPSPAASPRHP